MKRTSSRAIPRVTRVPIPHARARDTMTDGSPTAEERHRDGSDHLESSSQSPARTRALRFRLWVAAGVGCCLLVTVAAVVLTMVGCRHKVQLWRLPLVYDEHCAVAQARTAAAGAACAVAAPVLVLTCTVTVHRDIAQLVQTDAVARATNYADSLRRWLRESTLPVVVVENSGYTWPEVRAEHAADLASGRLELHATDPQAATWEHPHPLTAAQRAALRTCKSKGFHECASVQYALAHSRLVRAASHIVKVTGRYFAPQLEAVLRAHHDAVWVQQRDPARCEIVGCAVERAHQLFAYPPRYAHVERGYAELVAAGVRSDGGHLRLPQLAVTPVRNGGYNRWVHQL